MVMITIKKILFPVDLTEGSSKVLPYVLSFSEKYGSEVLLLHVVQDLQRWGDLDIPRTSLEKLQQDALKGAEKAMRSLCDEKLKGRRNFKTKIVWGDPAEVILKVISSEKIDLVIMGTRGRKGLEHTIFGSVADTVVKKGTVPVVTVNPWKIS